MPKVSVIIPVYNVEKYLRECLDSVVSQTLRDIEIICVDDGSTDGSSDILNEYAQKDKRIKVITIKNSGASHARNIGMRNATGDYVGFIDSDDWVDNNFYKYLYEKVRVNAADIVKGKMIREMPNNKKVSSKLNSEIEINKYNFVGEYTCAIYRREYLLSNNIFFPEDIITGEDIIFSLNIIFTCPEILIENCAKYHYRYRKDSESKTLNKQKKLGLIKCICTIIDLLNSSEIDKETYCKHVEKYTYKHILRRTFHAKIKYPEAKKLLLTLKKQISNKIKYPIESIQKPNFRKMYCEQYGIMYRTPMQYVFSIIENAKEKKIYITILGIKIKIKSKKLELLDKENNLNNKITKLTNELTQLKDNYQKNLLTDLSILQTSYNLHQQIFPKYKNINAGKDVVLIATGPSLKHFVPIENAVYVGVNKAFMYDKVKFDYLFLQDFAYPTEEYIDDFINYNKETTKKFIGYLNCFRLKNNIIPEKYSYCANVERYYILDPSKRDYLTFDISTEPLADFGSIIFPAMQFICWTNPKRIYVVGCDCTNSGYYNNSSLTKNPLNVDRVILGWNKIKEFGRIYYPDTEIISVNPVGLKGLFNECIQTEELLIEE